MKVPREIEVLSKIEKTARAGGLLYTNIWRYNSETFLDDDRFYGRAIC